MMNGGLCLQIKRQNRIVARVRQREFGLFFPKGSGLKLHFFVFDVKGSKKN
jgi:hypothetical protein